MSYRKRMLIKILTQSDMQDDLVVLLVEKITAVERLTLNKVIEIGVSVGLDRLKEKGVSVADARKEVEENRGFMNPLLYWICIEVLDRM